MKNKLLFLSVAAAVLLLSVSCSGSSGSASNDAGSLNLKSLTVSPGLLVPAFDPDETDYTVNVANSVTQITLTAVTADFYAACGSSGDGPVDDGNNTDLKWTFNLTAGVPNIIMVTVSEPLTAKKALSVELTHYYITVTRADH